MADNDNTDNEVTIIDIPYDANPPRKPAAPAFGQVGPTFGISLKELRELMELRGTDAIEHLDLLNGTHGLCTMLDTTPNGKKYLLIG